MDVESPSESDIADAELAAEFDVPTDREATQTIGVAGWTMVSRITGLARVAIAGAILGPTFFANIFQATNTIPNLTYNLMAGSLLTSLIVPSLVKAYGEGGLARARVLTRRLTGIVLAGFSVAALVVVAAGPIIVHLLTLGVRHDADAGRALQITWVLLLLVVPQIVLYGLIAVAIAAQNARHHFSLAAAAPAIENIGLIITLMVCAVMYGTGTDISNVSNSYLTVLGIGATLSVAAHAAVQCWGAWRAGLPLVPGWKWHDPEIRVVRQRMVPTIGTASLDAAWTFILIVAAGTIPGGVVAFQIGLNFYNLPLALSAKAVGTVLLPRMAQDFARSARDAFRATYDRGMAWSWFIAVPAGAALLLFAKPIGRALAFGEMKEGDGVALITASVAVLGLALFGAATKEFARQACYARHDVKTPFISGVVLVVITLIGAPIAVIAFSGPAALAALGAVVVVGETARAFICDIAARRDLPNLQAHPVRTLVRDSIISVIALAPAALAARIVTSFGDGRMFEILEVAAGVGVGLVAYLAIQGLLGAPEMPERVRRGSSRLAPTEVAP